ncbi:hypothetical protein EXW72_24770 [Pseudomonas sp. BCA14]|nr:hypothetical protein EXW71_21685 [Pseudomonas sp. BCA17]TFF09310.1 hypothetical protein EXW70_09700 [Pseudomonas sp. JMN1]TFF19424.1 hypothetical protein EXW72_24770 [Pseudomonas sp. BCA14]TFF24164.1 hypothetical protein EXW73_16910 [Pseudomonas sp. BCA13]
MDQKQIRVKAGLLAMQKPRYIRHTQPMSSQASQLPQADQGRHKNSVGFQAAAFAFDLRRPVKHAGRTQA